jgi:putative drug exporter of the RND superfamily
LLIILLWPRVLAQSTFGARWRKGWAAIPVLPAGCVFFICGRYERTQELHFTAQPLDTSMLMLLFCIAFGLSMDYEVIVLSRIKELHDQGRDNRTAVTDGLTHSGRIVTTAAALIAVTFFANGTATVSFLQLFGIGAGFAVIIDATLVRAVLVPACQRMLGRAAWYAPAPLRRLQTRIALTDTRG